MLLTSFLILSAGFLALALAMDRHHRDVIGGPVPRHRRNILRLVGTLLLALGFTACGLARGWHFGPVWFTGLAAMSAFAVLLAVSLVPSVLKPPR